MRLEEGVEPDSAWVGENEQADARDGTTKPVSRDQIMKRERGEGEVTPGRIGNHTRLGSNQQLKVEITH